MRATAKTMAVVAAMVTIGMPVGSALATSAASTGPGVAGRAAPAQAATTSASRAARASTSAKPRRVGTSYFAPTTAGGGVSISLSLDGREVRRAIFAFRQTCTDGSSVYSWDPDAAIPVTAAGTFKANFDSGQLGDPTLPGETTRLVTSISGVISRSGARIVGTARVVFTAANADRAVKCDTGEVHFTATD